MESVKEKEKVSENKTKWTADPVHSEITFKVKHMMITTVTGILSDYHLDITSDGERFSNVNVNFIGQTSSISTGNEKRDTHLRSADFFDIDKYPAIIFISRDFKREEGNNFKLTGELTIRNVTKPVTLDVVFHGKEKDPWGATKAGFSVSGVLNRTDFGLKWNTPLESGGMLVSDDVTIACEIQVMKTA